MTNTLTTSRQTRANRPVHRGLLLLVLALTQLTITLDTTIVTVALPSLQADLDISDANRHWVITIYAIAFGGLLLLGGRLGDYIGRKRALVGSLIGFGLASLLGGLASTAGLVYAARGLQGAFAAVLAPVVLSLITTTFVEPAERARAFAVWGGVGGLGGSLGLILGGFLTEFTSWRWTLLVNTPLTVAIAVAAFMVVRESRVVDRSGYDLPGTIASTAGIAALVFGATQAESHGWISTNTLTPLVVGLILVVAFIAIERKTRNPLLPLSILTDRVRGSSFLATAFLSGAIFASNVLVIYYFQAVRGFSALQSGFAFLPSTLSIVVFATLGGRLMQTIGARATVILGAAAGVAGFLLLAGADVTTGLGLIIPAMVLIGVAVGLTWPVLSATALAGVPDEQAGAAGGAVNAAQQVSGAIAIAVLNTVAASVSATRGSLMEGLSVAFIGGAILLALTAIASLGIQTSRRDLGNHPS
ncbi:MAG: MFS transporter [Aeromicrobium sp.]